MSLADKLDSGEFAIIAEMPTPKGVDISAFMESARHLKGRIDAALLPDMGYAVMRMSSLAGALLLKEQGLDAILQFTCRDRNRLALQGDLLGAHVLGVRNVMAVEGVPIQMGDHLDAKPVHDLDVSGFLQAVGCMKSGKDLAGKELHGAPALSVGARIEPFSNEREMEERLAQAKEAVEKGAAYLITPPVFDLEGFKGFMEKAAELGAPVIGQVFLLKSVGMARYMNQNLPGVTIGEDYIKRIRSAGDRPKECVKIAGELTKGLKALCQGALLVAAGWESRLPEVLDEAAK